MWYDAPMNGLPETLKEELVRDPFYALCARQEALHDHVCMPNPSNGMPIEWEPVVLHEGAPILRRFAIVPLCWSARIGSNAIRAINVWIALNRATTSELLEISRSIDYFRARSDLNRIFGEYIEPTIHTIPVEIDYPWLQPAKTE